MTRKEAVSKVKRNTPIKEILSTIKFIDYWEITGKSDKNDVLVYKVYFNGQLKSK